MVSAAVVRGKLEMRVHTTGARESAARASSANSAVRVRIVRIGYRNVRPAWNFGILGVGPITFAPTERSEFTRR